jgi:hypothetical protein
LYSWLLMRSIVEKERRTKLAVITHVTRIHPVLLCQTALHAASSVPPGSRSTPPGSLLSCLLRSRCHRRSRSRCVNRKPPSRASPRGVGDVPQPPTHMTHPFTWPSGWRCALCASSRCSYPLRGIRPGPLRLGTAHSGTPHTTRGHAPLCVLRPVPRPPQEIVHLALSNFGVPTSAGEVHSTAVLHFASFDAGAGLPPSATLVPSRPV